MTWGKPKSQEGEQILCRTLDEGHMWLPWLDSLSPRVRERLRNASCNLCPACLIVAVGRGKSDAAYFKTIEAWEEEDRKRLGRWAPLKV